MKHTLAWADDATRRCGSTIARCTPTRMTNEVNTSSRRSGNIDPAGKSRSVSAPLVSADPDAVQQRTQTRRWSSRALCPGSIDRRAPVPADGRHPGDEHRDDRRSCGSGTFRAPRTLEGSCAPHLGRVHRLRGCTHGAQALPISRMQGPLASLCCTSAWIVASVPDTTRSSGRVALKTALVGRSGSTPCASRRALKSPSVPRGM